MLLHITVVKKKLCSNYCSYSLYFLPRCFNFPNPKPSFFLFVFLFFPIRWFTSSPSSYFPFLSLSSTKSHTQSNFLITITFLFLAIFFAKCGHAIQIGTTSINNCILVFQYMELYFILSINFLLIITIGIKLKITTSC